MAQQPVIGVPDRVVPMRIIVCGLHRTGTMSMRAALWQLGFHDCYHMHTVLQNLESHPPQWIRAIEAKYAGKGEKFTKADWDHLLGHSQACCDMPAAVFSVELAELYPDTKVVILNRDPEQWYQSALASVHKVLGQQSLFERATRFYCQIMDTHYRNWVYFAGAMIKHTMPFDHARDKAAAIKWFNGQYNDFRTRIPAERRFEFRVQDGWKPLCDYLGVPVPMVEDEATGKMVEAPFPRVNDRETFAANSRNILKQAVDRANRNSLVAIGKAALLAALGYGGLLAWRQRGLLGF